MIDIVYILLSFIFFHFQFQFNGKKTVKVNGGNLPFGTEIVWTEMYYLLKKSWEYKNEFFNNLNKAKLKNLSYHNNQGDTLYIFLMKPLEIEKFSCYGWFLTSHSGVYTFVYIFCLFPSCSLGEFFLKICENIYFLRKALFRL